MSKVEEYLRDLQITEMELDICKLRELFKEFDMYSKRLPQLVQDMESITEPNLGTNYEILIEPTHEKLIKISVLIDDMDNIPFHLKEDNEIQEFIDNSLLKISLNNFSYYRGRLTKLINQVQHKQEENKKIKEGIAKVKLLKSNHENILEHLNGLQHDIDWMLHPENASWLSKSEDYEYYLKKLEIGLPLIQDLFPKINKTLERSKNEYGKYNQNDIFITSTLSEIKTDTIEDDCRSIDKYCNKVNNDINEREDERKEEALKSLKEVRVEKVKNLSKKIAFYLSSFGTQLSFIIIIGVIFTIIELLFSEYKNISSVWLGSLILSIPVLIVSLIIFRWGSSCIDWSENFEDGTITSCSFDEERFEYSVDDLGEVIGGWIGIIISIIVIAGVIYTSFSEIKLFISNSEILEIIIRSSITIFIVFFISAIFSSFLGFIGGTIMRLIAYLSKNINIFILLPIAELSLELVESSIPEISKIEDEK